MEAPTLLLESRLGLRSDWLVALSRRLLSSRTAAPLGSVTTIFLVATVTLPNSRLTASKLSRNRFGGYSLSSSLDATLKAASNATRLKS